MSVKMVEFEAWHATDLIARNATGEVIPPALLPEVAQAIEAGGNAYSLIVDSDIVACGGTMQLWPGRHQAWMFFTPEAGPFMRRITNQVKKELDVTPGRVEMTVIKDYALGHRWAKILGFEVETPCLRHYGPAGEDHVGYARIN